MGRYGIIDIITPKEGVELEAEVTRQVNDVIMKAMAGTFKDKTLKIFGLNTPRIKAVIPTVLPVLEVKENRTDYIFLLEDDTLLHLEFMTTVTGEALKRFALYDVRLINRDDREVNTAVVYSGRIKKAPDRLEKGSINYKVTNVYMKDYDGDEEYRKLQEKISRNESLHEEEILKLVFLPLMKSSLTEDQMAVQAAELAKNIAGEIKTFVIGTLVAVTDRFMSEEYKKRLLEVLKMTQIEQWIRQEGIKEGRQEGIKEGIKEGEMKKAVETARAALKRGLPEDVVAEITGLDQETVRRLKAELN